MFSDFFVPFFGVGLAELGDKTQLALLLVSSRVRRRFRLLLGVVLAYFLVDGVAVFLGSWFAGFVSVGLLKVFSGVVFVFLGVLILRGGGEEGADFFYSSNPFLSGFVLILVAEWGDKTQVAAALFASKYSPLLVLLGAVSALAFLSAAAVYFGGFISERVDRNVMAKVAGVVFILMGLSFILL
jgi:putative Ca2+/H+ antiporter (TMEM165/GDT1 family)